MKGPVVSVILPTRDRSGSLPGAVESVLAQTHPSIELIVVDDGSRDGTGRYLDEVAASDRRLRAIRLDEPRGAAAARNVGIAEARGAYVAFQDDDTRWEPGKLERQLQALDDAGDGTGLCWCPVVRVLPSGESMVTGHLFSDDPLRGPASASTVAVVADAGVVRLEGGFDERLPRLQDFDLWVRLLRRTGATFVDEPLVRTRREPGGISGDREALVTALTILEKKYGAMDGISSVRRSALFHLLGMKWMMAGRWSRGLRIFLRALRIDPRRLSGWIALAAALAGPRVFRFLVGVREAWAAPGRASGVSAAAGSTP